MKRVKITVLQRSYHKDLAKRNGVEGLIPCPMFQEGQVFYAIHEKPEGFCDRAWKAISSCVLALANGTHPELFCYEGGMKIPGVAISSCNDGLRPVIFKLEAEEEVPSIPETYTQDEQLDYLLTMQEQIVDALNCGVFVYTLPEHTTLVVNRAMKKIFGLENEKSHSFGNSLMEHIVPEDIQIIRNAVASLRQVGDSIDYKVHIRKDDETVALGEIFSKYQAFENGKEFILSVVQDITDQEELRISLNRERQLYRYALDRGVDCCFTFDVTTGLVTEPVFIRGLDLLSVLGLSLPAHFDELSARFFEHYHIQTAEPSMMDCYSCAGLMKLYQKGCFSAEAECYVPQSGTYYNALVVMSPDEEDGHLYALYFSRNVTELRNREKEQRRELRDAREELAVSNEELHDALLSEQEKIKIIGAISKIYVTIFHIDLETGHYTDVNHSGYMGEILKDCPHATEAFRRCIEVKVAASFRDKVTRFVNLSTLQIRMRKETTISIEYLTMKNKWVRSSFIEVKRGNQGKLTEVLFVSEWIDKEKRKELMQQQALKDAYDAANRASEAKTNFLSSMSHDIRTPMNVIIGMTAIAGTHLEDRERVADCLAKITTSSKHLLGLLNEVLDMNKIESGKLDLCMQEFHLSDLVDNLLTMAKPQIESRRHELTVNIHNVEHEEVVGDSQRIQQVFMNLMSNAIKYTPEGGRIALDISEKPTNHRLVGCYEFVFQDNGIGMSEDFIPHIFEPFSRAKDSMVEKMQGTGLGMAITHNIVRMMNGDIKVESKLGQGTKFTVTIYLELQDVNETTDMTQFVDLPILVVDDDEISCEAACIVLCDLGMNAEWVLSGEEAVELVGEHHDSENDFFAVIIDWKMPGMDGIATTKAIRKRVGNDVPIIIISAYDWSDIEAEARAAGVNGFLSKPIFKSRMVHLFKTLLGEEVEMASEFNLTEFKKKDFSGKRVLLVEDNAINAEIASEILSMAGVEIEFASNGKEAVDRIAQVADDYYDIVFMDVQMPVMNGYEATRAIRSMSRAYAKRVPILAMTANAFAEDVQASKNAGMNEHIAKPLNFEELLKALNRWLD